MTKEEIKKDIKNRNMSRKEYAKLFQVELSTVNSWLSGVRIPSKQTKMLMQLSTSTIERISIKI